MFVYLSMCTKNWYHASQLVYCKCNKTRKLRGKNIDIQGYILEALEKNISKCIIYELHIT